jgi:hypothetical protein
MKFTIERDASVIAISNRRNNAMLYVPSPPTATLICSLFCRALERNARWRGVWFHIIISRL